MKSHSLISAVVLGMAVFVQAQTSLAPQAPKPALKFTDESGTLIADTLILKAGPLTEVVAQVERQVKENPKQPNGFLPNLVYAKDIRDAVVPGDLILRGVTPVQALALVAAAADCTFRPIFAPDEKAGQKTMIIGYRIEPQAASGSGKASDGRAMNTLGSPFGSSGGSSGTSASTGGTFAPMGGLLPSVQVVDPNTSRGMSSGNDRNRVPKNSFAEPPGLRVDNKQPFVRVYAIGFIMTGADEEKEVKVKNLEELIGQALGQAKLNLNPDLNIHVKTGALMSKATAAQHEIIEQVVQALKENATQPAAPAKP